MMTSYCEEDVTFLLKDITGLVVPQPTEEREKLIQSGKHYCEMLPIEYTPTAKYMQIYDELLNMFAERNAQAIANLACSLDYSYGSDIVLVSLARAGTPIGILLKRYMAKYFHYSPPHYSISIIRGKGIDENALNYVLSKHKAYSIVFVDGWTGKGAISNQLTEALFYSPIHPVLAVLADPAGVADFYGTRDDLLVPSCCLNSTVCGLISRTFLRNDIIGPKDYHGAVYYGNLKDVDLSENFLSAVESYFTSPHDKHEVSIRVASGVTETVKIASDYGIKDINLIKPGIGETTRVLLRRVPWKILISDKHMDVPDVKHILQLAAEKNVPVEYIPMCSYIAVGLIKNISDV
ncbi:MAG: cysteine protease StiP family protein [Lachnospiraceae bacterium]|nr:cysteine protease StiP family protein [Lachnospiraceae bacterium]